MKKFLLSVAILASLLLINGCTWQPTKESMLTSIPTPYKADKQLFARYFGASTILISDGCTSILVDGFFSRPFARALIYGMRPNHEKISKFLKAHKINKIDAMLITHSHFDHIMNSGTVARASKATVFGSKSAIDIVNKQKKFLDLHSGPITNDENVIDCDSNTGIKTINKPKSSLNTNIIKDGQTVEVGPFTIKFYKTEHFEKSTTLRMIELAYLFLSRGLAYRDGGDNYSFLISHTNLKKNILVVPSAGDITHLLPDVTADVVFLSVGLLGKEEKSYITDYWNEAVVKTKAKLVIPIHWDNFNGTSLKPSPYPIDNLKKSIGIITELSKQDPKNPVSICYPPGFGKTFSIDNPSDSKCN